MVAVTVWVASLITDTLLLPALVTYTVPLFGSTPTANGVPTKGTVVTAYVVTADAATAPASTTTAPAATAAARPAARHERPEPAATPRRPDRGEPNRSP